MGGEVVNQVIVRGEELTKNSAVSIGTEVVTLLSLGANNSVVALSPIPHNATTNEWWTIIPFDTHLLGSAWNVTSSSVRDAHFKSELKPLSPRVLNCSTLPPPVECFTSSVYCSYPLTPLQLKRAVMRRRACTCLPTSNRLHWARLSSQYMTGPWPLFWLDDNANLCVGMMRFLRGLIRPLRPRCPFLRMFGCSKVRSCNTGFSYLSLQAMRTGSYGHSKNDFGFSTLL